MERLTEWVNDGETKRAVPRMELRRNGHQRCCNKLAAYEDAEEQGMLIRLPCKVGETVYEICNDCTYSCMGEEEYENCTEWEYEDCTECPHSKMNIHEQVFVTVEIIVYNMDKFGKTVFLTREEAEKALERMG